MIRGRPPRIFRFPIFGRKNSRRKREAESERKGPNSAVAQISVGVLGVEAASICRHAFSGCAAGKGGQPKLGRLGRLTPPASAPDGIFSRRRVLHSVTRISAANRQSMITPSELDRTAVTPPLWLP